MPPRRTPAEDAEALRISNAIDDELRVRPSHLSLSCPFPSRLRPGAQREREALRRRKSRDVKGTSRLAHPASPRTHVPHASPDPFHSAVSPPPPPTHQSHPPTRPIPARSPAHTHTHAHTLANLHAPPAVMLLGQAESGKSTLQKQFQLYYSSQTLENERPSWRPIVYFNILRAIRMILDELDWEYGLVSGSGDPLSSSSSAPSLAPAPSTSHSGSHSGGSGSGSGSSTYQSRAAANPAWFPELALLRNKLLPLVASEDALGAELSGGITVSGGRTGVYVRAGWQALNSASRSWPLAEDYGRAGAMTLRQSAVTNIVAKTLAAVMDEIEGLWWHPGVQGLLRGNKLKLEEYAALCVSRSLSGRFGSSAVGREG